MVNVFSWFNFRCKTSKHFHCLELQYVSWEVFFFLIFYRACLIILVIPICFFYFGSTAFFKKKSYLVYRYSSMTLFWKYSPYAFGVASEHLHNFYPYYIRMSLPPWNISYLHILLHLSQSSGNIPRLHLVCLCSRPLTGIYCSLQSEETWLLNSSPISSDSIIFISSSSFSVQLVNRYLQSTMYLCYVTQHMRLQLNITCLCLSHLFNECYCFDLLGINFFKSAMEWKWLPVYIILFPLSVSGEAESKGSLFAMSPAAWPQTSMSPLWALGRLTLVLSKATAAASTCLTRQCRLEAKPLWQRLALRWHVLHYDILSLWANSSPLLASSSCTANSRALSWLLVWELVHFS